MIGVNRFNSFLGPAKKYLQHTFSFQDIFKNNKNVTTLRYLTSVPKIFEGPKIFQKNDELKITRDTISCVNEHIKNGKEGRLFAVVHVCGKQFKITPEDIIIVEGYWPPRNGDEIKLEKVLLVGGLNFTLIGRPILPQALVTVRATVIEKDLSHTKTIFYKRRRKQYERINFFRSQFTMLRINEVSVNGKINEHKAISQYQRI
uniref:Large ribosomal subunit protein bL21m n=1 Tax=Riptortus pedestris TaxID=329032 RepID=R4WDG4_RIPPE|nr:mitochondrial ribosomal protein L21 [Riptortus pedestris]